jgi:hypothetical protein
LFSADVCWHNITTFVSQRKRRRLFCVLIVFISASAEGAFERTITTPAGSPGGPGGWFYRPADVFQMNPSFLSAVAGYSANVYYSPSPFGLRQLSGGGFSAVFPFDGLAIGSSMNTTGFSLYREFTGTIAAARKINPGVSCAIALTMDHLSIERYGSSSAIEAGIGLTVLLSDQCSWNASLSNIFHASIGQSKDPLPQYYSTGLEYVPIGEMHLKCSVAKEIRSPASFSTSVTVIPLEILSLSAGITTEPSRFYGGIDLNLCPVRLSYALLTHAELGMSHVIGCSFEF